jgi:hypothetical protein
MKGIKIFIVILLFVLLCFCLTACDPPQFFHEDLTGKVVGIQLVNYNNSDAKGVNTFVDYKNPEKDMLPFDFNKMQVIETLSSEEIEDFLKELSAAFIIKAYVHFDSPNGTCIRLIYDNGDFEIISRTKENSIIALYNESGEILQYIGIMDNRNDFINLINNYFTPQID